jgi:hypothetical protein
LSFITAAAPEHQQALNLLAAIQAQSSPAFAAASRAWDQEPVRPQQQNRYLEQEREKAQAEQRTRDEDAELSSYWPTTIRVDTDMDSFWLPNEERVCQTYPDNKGRVVIVACNARGEHRDHNIPVTFYGGVNRNTISEWKCRKEKSLFHDGFVCRSVN